MAGVHQSSSFQRALTVLREAPESSFHVVVHRELSRLNDQDKVLVLSRASESEDDELRQRATAALRFLPEALASPLLKRGLCDANDGVRAMAIESVGFLNSKQGAALLMEHLETDSPHLEVLVGSLRRLVFQPLEVEGPDPRLFVNYVEIPEQCRGKTVANWKAWWDRSATRPWAEVIRPYGMDSLTVYR